MTARDGRDACGVGGMRAIDVVPSPLTLLLAADVPHADRAVRAGDLVRLARGVHTPAEAYRAAAPWDRYLTRVHAIALARPDAVFVMESAAALRGLPVFGEPRDVHVVVESPHTSRATRGIRTHSADRLPQIETLGGIRLASAADVAVDAARLRHPAIALGVACAALRADPGLSTAELARLNAERPSNRGARRALWPLERAVPAPESVLESISLAVIEWLGFPAPELQKWIRDDRLDFWWPQRAVAGEADGDVKYSGALGDARAALRARSARDARLLTRGVSATAHWGWSDVAAPRQLRAILLAAGLRPERPEHPEPLRTLGLALASAPQRETAPVHRDTRF